MRWEGEVLQIMVGNFKYVDKDFLKSSQKGSRF